MGGEEWDGRGREWTEQLPPVALHLIIIKFISLFSPATISGLRDGTIPFLHLSPLFHKIPNNSK